MKSIIDPHDRRKFLIGAAASAATLALHEQSFGAPSSPQTLSGRFLTHVSVVRVNQIEVTPTRSIGEDKSADNARSASARGAMPLRAAVPTAK